MTSALSLLGKFGMAPVVGWVVRVCAAIGVDVFRIRYAWQAMLPDDPLQQDAALPQIDVLIPAHPKDLRVLPYAVASIARGVRNPIRRIVLVVPDEAAAEISAALPSGCEVRPESPLLGELLPWTLSNVPSSWRGWVIQQSIKYIWVLRNDAPVLVLDADTVLQSRRAWVNADGRQLLCLSAERHRAYVSQASRCWQLSRAAQAVSYVTHHQLMQPDVLRAMFPEGAASLQHWIEAADFSMHAALSEYHCYGAWLRSSAGNRVVLGRFGNRSRAGEELEELALHHDVSAVLDALAQRYPERLSLSFHSWRSET